MEGALVPQLKKEISAARIRPGDTVAVGVGSRGIDRLAEVVQITCQCLLDAGAQPTVIPAMGSHGGATGEGQEALLVSLGVTRESCSAPIQSTLETARIGTVFNEVPVYFSKDALSLDHTVIINRIKPHTKFKAPIESGLLKMLCVGMGKHDGALSYHNHALTYGFYDLLKTMGEMVLEKSNLRFGIGLVENAYDRIMTAEVVPSDRFMEREPMLLELSKRQFPSLPLTQLDVLVVGKIGKEISGAGMDPNVTGRAFDLKESDFSEMMRAVRVAILRLSEKSDGNALGIGNADFITEKLYQSMDYEKTIMNGLTSNSLHKAYVPIRLPTEEKAIQACFTTLGPIPYEKVRAVLISDTLHVSEFWASSALRHELGAISNASLSEDVSLDFDENGYLQTPHLI